MDRVEHLQDFLCRMASVVARLDIFAQEVERCPHAETVRLVDRAQGVLQCFPGHKTKGRLPEDPEAEDEVLDTFTLGQKEQERTHLGDGSRWANSIRSSRRIGIFIRSLAFLRVLWYLFRHGWTLTAGPIQHNIRKLAMIVPIFPLPNVVLFPKTLMPLHIFEERYRAMTREALAGDRQIAMVLLREGWETKYYENPAIHDVACLGKIETYEELEEGKYNIVLSGIHRVRLIREIQHSPYRLAEVEALLDEDCDDQSSDVIRRRNHIGGLFTRFTELATAGKYRAVELVPQLNFEALVNMVASTLNLPVEEKQLLLEMDEVVDRCDALIPILQRQLEALILVRNFEHIKPEDPSKN